jgi:hypothetical protein
MSVTSIKFDVIAETPNDKLYAVRPNDIYVGPGCLLSSFGAAEIEQEAARLVKFFQRKGHWSPFRMTELSLFYHENGWDARDALCGLAKPWFHDWDGWVPAAKPYVVQDSEGRYFVTNLFIERCRAATDPTQFLAMIDTVVEIINSHTQALPKPIN